MSIIVSARIWAESEIKVEFSEHHPPRISISSPSEILHIYFNSERKLEELIEKLKGGDDPGTK